MPDLKRQYVWKDAWTKRDLRVPNIGRQFYISNAALWSVLEAMVRLDGGGDSWIKLPIVSGYSSMTVFYVLKHAEQYGCVTKSYRGHWQLTERGKIALAISNGKRRRGNMRKIKTTITASILILLAGIEAAAQRTPRAPPPIVMQVAPDINQVISAQSGQPVQSFSYTISSTRSQLRWTVSGLPAWISTGTANGRTPATVTFNVDTNLAAGDYYANLVFTNADTGQGNTQRSVHLTITVPPPVQPTWGFVASAFQTEFNRLGDILNFRYVVTNTGTVDITTIVIESSLGSSGCAADTLAPGNQFGCQYDYTVRQIDIDTGSVTDHATAKSLANPPTPTPIQVTTSVPYVAPVPPSPGTVDILTSDSGDRLVGIDAQTPADYLTDELPAAQPVRVPGPASLLQRPPPGPPGRAFFRR